MRESQFQAQLIKKLNKMLPGIIILKNDPNYIQGIPDLILLYKNRWAALECSWGHFSECLSPSEPGTLCSDHACDVVCRIHLP